LKAPLIQQTRLVRQEICKLRAVHIHAKGNYAVRAQADGRCASRM
jgi:hypothetical protein